jgi:DNA-binding GntR family transcriptional regulator
VRKLVWDGELRAGDRVRQEEIASALGVSRVPVREGLVALESEGLVRHEPQKGVFVVGLDQGFVRDHYELLGLVLGYIIEQATDRDDPDLRDRLADLNERLKNAQTPETVFPIALEFKETTYAVGGSARARAAVRGMERLVPGNLHEEIPGAVDITRSGISEIAEAIQHGDGPAANSACRTMTRELGQLVLRELERRGLLD